MFDIYIKKVLFVCLLVKCPLFLALYIGRTAFLNLNVAKSRVFRPVPIVSVLVVRLLTKSAGTEPCMESLSKVQPSTRTTRSRNSHKHTSTMTNIEVLSPLKARLRKRVQSTLPTSEVLSSATSSPSMTVVAAVTRQPTLRPLLAKRVVGETWPVVPVVTVVAMVRSMRALPASSRTRRQAVAPA